MGKPKIVDVDTIIAAGINPKTGLPIRMGGTASTLKEDLKRIFRIKDEQDFVNRYTWYNLPCNITSQELERMLYYKGQLCFFYMEDLDQYFFMPYALDGTIDFYGRFNTIHPVPMTSGTEDKGDKAQAELLSKIKLNCVYGIKLPDEVKDDDFKKSTVLLHDYSKQLSQTIINRQVINDPLINIMSEIIPMMRTSLINASGVQGVRVNDADQQESVRDGSRSLLDAALTGNPWVPLLGTIDFQELTGGSSIKSQDFMLALQELDNVRRSTHGLGSGNMFEKEGTVLQAQNAVNQSNVSLILQDGLNIRQNFCNIVNSIWGLGIWCDVTENLMNADVTGDGLSYEENYDGENGGVETGGEE